MDKLFVIKIGGNIIDDEVKLQDFLMSFSHITDKRILVHGGGKLATKLANDLHIEQKMVEGRRITDQPTLDIVTMVYAGLINKNIVAKLQANNLNSIGLSGADGNTITSQKRQSELDYGYVGDVTKVNGKIISAMLQEGLTPIFSAITHDGKGQLLNTNADTIAQELATGLTQDYDVTLIYCFEKEGVLLDVEDESSVILKLNKSKFEELKESKAIHSGMIPKLDNAFAAIDKGISSVVIGKAEKLSNLISGHNGTTII
jgi:acetylglutamate kinase